MREVNEAVAGVYLSGGNTRRIRGALRPLLKNAPLSKSAVSRIVTTLRGEWETWRMQSLADLNVVYLYLDAIALRVRSAGRVTGLPVLAAVAVLSEAPLPGTGGWSSRSPRRSPARACWGGENGGEALQEAAIVRALSDRLPLPSAPGDPVRTTLVKPAELRWADFELAAFVQSERTGEVAAALVADPTG